MSRIRHQEALWSVVFFILSVWVYATASALDGGAGRFPMVAAAIMGVSGALTLMRLALRGGDDAAPDSAQWGRLATIAAAILAALLALRTFGFPIVSVVLFTICALAAGGGRITVRSILIVIAQAVVAVVLMTAIFIDFLGVSLPMGPIGP